MIDSQNFELCNRFGYNKVMEPANFLCDPDLHHEVPKYLIDNFFKSMKSYERTFKDSEGNIVIHTWEKPYPQIYFKPEEKIEEKKVEEEKEDNDDEDKDDNEDKEENKEENKEGNKEGSNSEKKYETEEEIMNELNFMEQQKIDGIKIDRKLKKKVVQFIVDHIPRVILLPIVSLVYNYVRVWNIKKDVRKRLVFC